MKELPTFEEKKKTYPGKHPDRQNTKWSKEIARKCKHKWQPVSFAFEVSMHDGYANQQRMPDINDGRVYCVCMKCCAHTYIVTGYVGYYIGSPDLLESPEEIENTPE